MRYDESMNASSTPTYTPRPVTSGLVTLASGTLVEVVRCEDEDFYDVIGPVHIDGSIIR